MAEKVVHKLYEEKERQYIIDAYESFGKKTVRRWKEELKKIQNFLKKILTVRLKRALPFPSVGDRWFRAYRVISTVQVGYEFCDSFERNTLHYIKECHLCTEVVIVLDTVAGSFAVVYNENFSIEGAE